MDAPKISVLIPLYNRKQYAADCINGVLNQTFTDFEIIIRDDCSSDGVFEFVQENFSDRRIKLFRNKKNLGEAENINLLTETAAGKYFTILHNDDLYLRDALQNLYDAAERFNADVVHSASCLIGSENLPLRKIFFEKLPVQKLEVVSNAPLSRFNEWYEGKIFRDAQYNLFNRKFILANKIFSEVTGWDSLLVALNWIMKAKILVKTPVTFYIRRENSDSQSAVKNIVGKNFENEISRRIELFRRLDEFINSFELFRNNDALKYKIKARLFGVYEDLNFDNATYGDEKFAGVYNSIENTFRKYFGEDAVYLAMTYHWAHAMHFNQNRLQGLLKDCTKILDRNI